MVVSEIYFSCTKNRPNLDQRSAAKGATTHVFEHIMCGKKEAGWRWEGWVSVNILCEGQWQAMQIEHHMKQAGLMIDHHPTPQAGGTGIV
jgi:hypothetical protein